MKHAYGNLNGLGKYIIIKKSKSYNVIIVYYRCSKELNQWDILLEYSKLNGHLNPFLILDSAWRIPDWNVMSEALSCVDNTCPKEFLWKVIN